MSPATKSKGKLTRSTFNTAVKPLVKIFGGKSESEVFDILNNYFLSFDEAILLKHDLHDQMFNTTFFKAICGFFPIAAAKVKDRFGAIYNADNFYHFLEKIGTNIKASKLKVSGVAYKPLVKALEECFKEDFQL
ncbi:hypothetical protein [Microbulbifer sp. JTAC008]|uniref:hypothetical protein n=1 Tax=unclassified Microbulbifer TaxID=2619833 RepID=UPI00403A693F